MVWPIADILFCEAHWLFAFYYMKIAKNMPRILKQDNNSHLRDSHQDEIVTTGSTLDEQPKEYLFVYWVGLIANALFPLAEVVFNIAYVHFVDVEKVPLPNWVRDGEIVSINGMFATQIIAGCVLVWSVYTIFTHLHSTDNQ
jgi:hypothetical protein